MTQGTDPNDIYHNGQWYNRDGEDVIKGALSAVTQGLYGPTAWTEDGVNYTATYVNGKIATVSDGTNTKTFSYANGKISGVVITP